MDNRLGARLVLDYLAELGHRRIAFIGSARLGDLHERGEAYAEFMAEQLGGVPAGYLQLVENALEEGYQAMTRLLALPHPPTAVFAADDNMAIGAMKVSSAVEKDGTPWSRRLLGTYRHPGASRS